MKGGSAKWQYKHHHIETVTRPSNHHYHYLHNGATTILVIFEESYSSFFFNIIYKKISISKYVSMCSQMMWEILRYISFHPLQCSLIPFSANDLIKH